MLVLTFMTSFYIAGRMPYKGMKSNLNELFNEITVLLCIYIVMAMMMVYKGVKFVETMTIVFIVIVAINLVVFLAQTVSSMLM